MKKKLPVAQMVNELKRSPFFRLRESKKSSNEPQPKPARSSIVKKHHLNKTARKKSVEKRLPKFRTSELPKSVSYEHPNYRSYELRNFDKLKRLDVRLTREQRRFLDDLEDDIREKMPEMEQGNDNHRRITKSAIVRVFIEVFRQLDIEVDGSKFRSELDLLELIRERLKNTAKRSG